MWIFLSFYRTEFNRGRNRKGVPCASEYQSMRIQIKGCVVEGSVGYCDIIQVVYGVVGYSSASEGTREKYCFPLFGKCINR